LHTAFKDVASQILDEGVKQFGVIAELEKGVCPWLRPWNAEHMAGKISSRISARRSGSRPIPNCSVPLSAHPQSSMSTI
jgi:hypothetical protein